MSLQPVSQLFLHFLTLDYSVKYTSGQTSLKKLVSVKCSSIWSGSMIQFTCLLWVQQLSAHLDVLILCSGRVYSISQTQRIIVSQRIKPPTNLWLISFNRARPKERRFLMLPKSNWSSRSSCVIDISLFISLFLNEFNLINQTWITYCSEKWRVFAKLIFRKPSQWIRTWSWKVVISDLRSEAGSYRSLLARCRRVECGSGLIL